METVLPFKKCFMSLLKGDLLIKAALMLIETIEMREHGAPWKDANSNCGHSKACPLWTQPREEGLALMMGSLERAGSPTGTDLPSDPGEVI